MTVVFSKGFYQTVEKSDGAVLAAADDLFTIAGGPVLVTEFVGIVTTAIGGVANCQIKIVVTEPAGTVNLTAGALLAVPRIAWLCPIGTINATCSAARTGNIKWYIGYYMLSQYSSVVAAA